MALINCPECNKQISDKAVSCPNCGYPLQNNQSNINQQNNELYILILDYVIGKNFEYINLLQKVFNFDFWKASEIVTQAPSILAKGITLETAKKYQKQLNSVPSKTIIEPYDTSQSSDVIISKYKNNTIRCPRCGSTSITTGQRGFTWTTGFLGSNKTTNRCGKCGYKWQP